MEQTELSCGVHTPKGQWMDGFVEGANRYDATIPHFKKFLKACEVYWPHLAKSSPEATQQTEAETNKEEDAATEAVQSEEEEEETGLVQTTDDKDGSKEEESSNESKTGDGDDEMKAEECCEEDSDAEWEMEMERQRRLLVRAHLIPCVDCLNIISPGKPLKL